MGVSERARELQTVARHPVHPAVCDEDVLFRGLLDPYLHGSAHGPDRASALYGSALWGVWHLPVAFIALGVLTIPYLVFVHTTMGYFMATAWRRTGNLAVPGVSHAVIDALRNAVAVL
jgi:membrane protease YdiL (CAAX protease family)